MLTFDTLLSDKVGRSGSSYGGGPNIVGILRHFPIEDEGFHDIMAHPVQGTQTVV